MALHKNLNLIVWILGLTILIIGLKSLHNIFTAERDDARAELLARQNALTQFALKSLKQNLHNRLKYAQVNIHQIINDPLAADGGLLYINQGTQVLPRPIHHLKNTHQAAEQLYHWVKTIDPLDIVIENASPWEQRLHLLSNFKLAIENNNSDEIRWAFREIRENRTRANLSAEQDIPFMLALVEYFIEKSSPGKTILQGVVRDGSIIEQEHGMFGLQRTLLANRNRFTFDDFIFLRDKILDLSKTIEVPYQDFLQQSKSNSQRIDVNHIQTAAESFAGQFYIEPIGGEELLGISVDFDTVLKEIEQEMQYLKLIGRKDYLSAPSKPAEFSAINNLQINIISDTWIKIQKEISDLYTLKTSLLTATAILALIIVVLANIMHIRKTRTLALKYDFISSVSHELRTPLAALRLLSETLDRRWKTKKNIEDYPKRIVSVIDELYLLIENILSFNRLSKNIWDPKMSIVSLKEVINSVAYEIKPYIIKPFEIDTDELDDIDICGDVELIKMLFRNLMSNSCKYNNTEKIKILICNKPHSNKNTQIYYQDNGLGIPSKQWPEVFKEFTRIKSHEKSISGTGLGLAICKKIMRLHKGNILIVDSNSEGTTFLITFAETRTTQVTKQLEAQYEQ